MRKVFTDVRLFVLIQLKQQLLEAGISCFVKNEMLAGGTGELPFTETWPELWIHNNADYEPAMELVNAFKATLTDDAPKDPWTCPKCGEDNDGHYFLCWSCGFELPLESA